MRTRMQISLQVAATCIAVAGSLGFLAFIAHILGKNMASGVLTGFALGLATFCVVCS